MDYIGNPPKCDTKKSEVHHKILKSREAMETTSQYYIISLILETGKTYIVSPNIWGSASF